MGTDPSSTDLFSGPLPELYRTLYSETLFFMADQLGLKDYALESDHHHVEVATRDLELRAGVIKAGTVAATEWRWHLSVAGRRRLSLAIIWTMDPTLPRYLGRPHWALHMTGKPEVTVAVDLHDPVDSGVLTTASQYIAAGIVMRAIPVVVNAEPGIIEPVVFAPYRFPDVPIAVS